MQAVCIYTGVSPFEQNLDYIFSIFKNTLNELGVTVDMIDLPKLEIDYFDGTKHPIMETIFTHIQKSQGVIFATTAQRFSINGCMQTFLEHLDYNIYGEVLYDKPCMNIITSLDNSEYLAGSYMNTLINSLGGFVLNNMTISKEYLMDIKNSEEIKQMIERYAEDFYRSLKQNRKFFISRPFKNSAMTKAKQEEKKTYDIQDIIKQDTIMQNQQQQMQNQAPQAQMQNEKQVRSLTGSQVANLYKKEVENSNQNYIKEPNVDNIVQNVYNKNQNNINGILQTMNSNELVNKYNNQSKQNLNTNVNNFNNSQQNDINNITKMISKGYENQEQNISPSINSLKQRTQSLYHYFQPQLATGINVVIQLNISGKEIFNGFLTIINGECTYTDGFSPSADVTIISDSIVWQEVLEGRCTLQKAFMLGRLKVKGNFVIISKFEQFFKII